MEDGAGNDGSRQSTHLTKSWVVKSSLFAIVLCALGVWGLFDATMVYPARGKAHASFMEFRYLIAAFDAGLLSLASVSDPVAALRELNEERKDTEAQFREALEGSLTAKRLQLDISKREWLISLSRVGLLNTERTMIGTPSQRLQELGAELAEKNPPKPLAAYDIPMQWLFVLVGFGGGGWFASLMLRAKRRVFFYDPADFRLTMPGGATITPDQISELDKRKWDKFFVTLRLNDGASVKLDLLRHTPLEQWILEMEKQTAGYEPEEDVEDEAESESDSIEDSDGNADGSGDEAE